MKSTSYRGVRGLAIGVLLLLVLLQVNWFWQAVQLQREEQDQLLQRLAPETALAVNRIGHDLFHGDLSGLADFPVERVEDRIDSALLLQGLEGPTYFAIYQEKQTTFHLSNAPEFAKELRQTPTRSCLTCINAFSVAPARETGESDSDYQDRMMTQSVFQYFGALDRTDIPDEEILWLSLYRPWNIAQGMQSLIYLFVLNLLLLSVMLYLFGVLWRSLRRHKQMGQVKEDFFNHMTHEFKTPLSSIRLASRVLRQSRDPEKNTNYHDLIERECQSLEGQVDKLLMLSLMDSQGLSLDRTTFSLNDLLREIPTRLRMRIEQESAALELKLTEPLPEIFADRDHLHHVISNLVENSLKYGGKGVQIGISTCLENDELQVLLRDNGPGIPPADQIKVFDRFYRAQKGNQYKGQGFGIGLSYVQTVVEAHGGSIRLNPQHSPGCEFIIRLPYKS